MASVADEILKLRFTPGPLQTLYLNEERANERFISHLGAITGWTHSAGKEGGGGADLQIVKADARANTSNAITYGIENPLVRALVLREALHTSGNIRSP